MAKVEIYTADYCPHCTRAKNLLSSKGAEFTEYDITHDDEQRAKLVEMAGGLKTVPQVFINGKHIGGSTYLHELDEKGELDKLLNE